MKGYLEKRPAMKVKAPELFGVDEVGGYRVFGGCLLVACHDYKCSFKTFG